MVCICLCYNRSLNRSSTCGLHRRHTSCQLPSISMLTAIATRASLSTRNKPMEQASNAIEAQLATSAIHYPMKCPQYLFSSVLSPEMCLLAFFRGVPFPSIPLLRDMGFTRALCFYATFALDHTPTTSIHSEIHFDERWRTAYVLFKSSAERTTPTYDIPAFGADCGVFELDPRVTIENLYHDFATASYDNDPLQYYCTAPYDSDEAKLFALFSPMGAKLRGEPGTLRFLVQDVPRREVLERPVTIRRNSIDAWKSSIREANRLLVSRDHQDVDVFGSDSSGLSSPPSSLSAKSPATSAITAPTSSPTTCIAPFEPSSTIPSLITLRFYGQSSTPQPDRNSRRTSKRLITSVYESNKPLEEPYSSSNSSPTTSPDGEGRPKRRRMAQIISVDHAWDGTPRQPLMKRRPSGKRKVAKALKNTRTSTTASSTKRSLGAGEQKKRKGTSTNRIISMVTDGSPVGRKIKKNFAGHKVPLLVSIAPNVDESNAQSLSLLPSNHLSDHPPAPTVAYIPQNVKRSPLLWSVPHVPLT